MAFSNPDECDTGRKTGILSGAGQRFLLTRAVEERRRGPGTASFDAILRMDAGRKIGARLRSGCLLMKHEKAIGQRRGGAATLRPNRWA